MKRKREKEGFEVCGAQRNVQPLLLVLLSTTGRPVLTTSSIRRQEPNIWLAQIQLLRQDSVFYYVSALIVTCVLLRLLFEKSSHEFGCMWSRSCSFSFSSGTDLLIIIAPLVFRIRCLAGKISSTIAIYTKKESRATVIFVDLGLYFTLPRLNFLQIQPVLWFSFILDYLTSRFSLALMLIISQIMRIAYRLMSWTKKSS